MIFDGMGSSILDRNLSQDNFILSHKIDDISSVSPCTTTSATISLYTGLSPKESGWLGWAPYFRETGSHTQLFLGTDYYTGEEVDLSYLKELEAEYIHDKIAKKEINVHMLSPFADRKYSKQPKDLDDLFALTKNICQEEGENFILTYWPEPDGLLHFSGTSSEKVKGALEQISQGVKNLSLELEDSIIIITADHGQIDVSDDIYLNDYPEIMEYLSEKPAMELRTVSFLVKPEHIEDFKSLFNRLFGDWFILVSHDEYIAKFLGGGKPHPKVAEFVGDFIAIATSHRLMRYKGKLPIDEFSAHHAGLCPEEMIVPLIVLECSK